MAGYSVFLHIITVLPVAVAVQIRLLTPFSSPCLPHSMPKMICSHSELFYEDFSSPKTSGPELCSQLLLIVAGDPHMPEHQEPFNTPLSSADGRPPVASCSYNTAHVTLRARAAAGLAFSGRRNMLSAAFICIASSARAGPLPGSRRRKDNNALSSPYF